MKFGKLALVHPKKLTALDWAHIAATGAIATIALYVAKGGESPTLLGFNVLLFVSCALAVFNKAAIEPTDVSDTPTMSPTAPAGLPDTPTPPAAPMAKKASSEETTLPEPELEAKK